MVWKREAAAVEGVWDMAGVATVKEPIKLWEDDLSPGEGGKEESEHWVDGIQRLIVRPPNETSATADADVNCTKDRRALADKHADSDASGHY